MSDAFPENLRYSKDHEWVRQEDDGTVTVGITAYAVEQLGDITMLTLPDSDATFDAGDSLGDIDSVKAVSELFAPIAGTVTQTNGQLDDTPELVNGDPYGDGWMIRFRPKEAAEVGELMDAAGYAKFVADSE